MTIICDSNTLEVIKIISSTVAFLGGLYFIWKMRTVFFICENQS